MLGGTIAGGAIGDGGKRMLPTEQLGPRPAAVRDATVWHARPEARTIRATKP